MYVGGYFAYRNARYFLAAGYRFGKRLTIGFPGQFSTFRIKSLIISFLGNNI
jgi:hypothetical protein